MRRAHSLSSFWRKFLKESFSQEFNFLFLVLCSVLHSSDTTRVIDNRYPYLFWWDLLYVVSRNKKVAKRSEASFAHFLTSSYIVYLLQTPLHRRSLSYLFLTQHDALNQIIKVSVVVPLLYNEITKLFCKLILQSKN